MIPGEKLAAVAGTQSMTVSMKTSLHKRVRVKVTRTFDPLLHVVLERFNVFSQCRFLKMGMTTSVVVLLASHLGLIYLVVVSVPCKLIHHAQDDILKFFKVNDGIDVTWLHAVNSPELLEQGLSGDTMMLEADVLMRNNIADGTPVMAHPPAVDSNLTLQTFLEKTTTSPNKGIKLDFKTIQVVEPSLKMMKNVTLGQQVTNPIWLNADILPGPCYDKVCVPVDHERFLSLCKSYYPNATLSISWKTGENMTASKNYYNWSQVLPMGKLVSQIAQPITFPFRANLVQRSWDQLQWLLDLSETFTVTIWSSTTDKVDPLDLVALQNNVSRERIYYDLPPDQEKAFKDALKSSNDIFKKKDAFAWKASAVKDCQEVVVGQNSVMFSGEGGTVVSEKTLYKVSNGAFSEFMGNISFINLDEASNSGSVTIKLHVKDETGVAVLSGQIVSLLLHSNGDFQFSVAESNMKNGSVKSENGEFSFRISEHSNYAKMRTVKCEITAGDKDELGKATVSLDIKSEPVEGHALITTGILSDAILVRDVHFAVALPVLAGCSSLRCCFGIISLFMLAFFHSLLS